jgi:hypothetical protein
VGSDNPDPDVWDSVFETAEDIEAKNKAEKWLESDEGKRIVAIGLAAKKEAQAEKAAAKKKT